MIFINFIVDRSATGRTTCAELELQDIANIEGGFRSLVRGDVVGGDLCFFPGMAAPSTVVVRLIYSFCSRC